MPGPEDRCCSATRRARRSSGTRSAAVAATPTVDGQGDGPATPPAAKSATEKVVGVVQYGDPRRIPGFSFDVGSDVKAEGIFPRLKTQLLTAFEPNIQSYCDTGDPFCAKGNNLEAHLDYVEKYDKTADKFLVGRLQAVGIE